MPRLPTIRVIGSHDISTSLRASPAAPRSVLVTVAMDSLLPLAGAVGAGVVAGGQLGAAVSPPRLLVGRPIGDRPQAADDPPVEARDARGDHAPGGLVHERHELVGESGHGAGDADAADIRAAADSVHP